ncbi:MAG: SMR family transporter [Candidatus Fermentibacteria bacterium]
MDRYTVTTFNYLIASLLSLFFFLSKGINTVHFTEAFNAFSTEFPAVMSGGEFSPAASAGWALVTGLPSGVLYFLGFIYLQKAIRESGVCLAGSFSKMGVLVPVLLAIFLWNELPSEVQLAGIFLALISILLTNIDLSNPSGTAGSLRPVLLILFLTVGLSEFSNKVFQRYGILEMKSLFLFFVFTTALIISGSISFSRRKSIHLSHILTGIAVGIPNYFASFFLILSLSKLKTAIVFPVYSAVTIVLLSLTGWLFFKEKLRMQDRIAVGLTVTALVLVNIRS